jgi:hypothetical protein
MKLLTIADIVDKYAMSESTVRRRVAGIKPAGEKTVKDANGAGHRAACWEPARISALFQAKKKAPAKKAKPKGKK